MEEVERPALSDHGAGRRRDACRTAAARTAPVEEALAHRAADRRSARSRARKEHHPSRSEAGQRQDHARRARSRCSTSGSRRRWRRCRRAGESRELADVEHDGDATPVSSSAPPRTCRRNRRKGFAADHRSDVFSFGVRALRDADGTAALPGGNGTDVLASVLIREPELQRLPADLISTHSGPAAALSREESEVPLAGDWRSPRRDRSVRCRRRAWRHHRDCPRRRQSRCGAARCPWRRRHSRPASSPRLPSGS